MVNISSPEYRPNLYGTHHLFNNVYYRNLRVTDKIILETQFYHKCNPEKIAIYRIYNVLNIGICAKCKSHIMPHKKLETILALKELNG